jgi:hypothetical protein
VAPSGRSGRGAATGTPKLAFFGPQHRVLRNTNVTSYSKSDLQSILGVSAEEALSAAEEMLAECVR